MGKIMIDTDVLIKLLEKMSLEALEKLAIDFELYISGIVAFEFLVGVYRTKKMGLKNLLERYLTIIPITYDILDLSAKIEADLMDRGEMLEPRDLIIGATAIYHEIPLWTENIKDFKRLERYGLTIKSIRI